ncbi:mitochondrial inner membrane protease subunit 2 isoform X2 [Mastacembelus armatus]|uniref:mitochondrial inner membrane protease subunit 2 isoform X2 n=1 Tax=Mastacembelus armatus TaxID=205130 RepID=UPI000E465537|nr:mitochondrial inner membrane protease subunit 2 isoform X2 [Mastacembelus armatus]
MAQQVTAGRRYLRAFVSGFFVAVPVTVTVLDRVACVARVEGASMQPFLNPEGGSGCDVVLLNRWTVRNYQVQRGDVVSIMSPRNPQQKIIKRVIGLEGDFIRCLWGCSMVGPPTSSGHPIAGSESNHSSLQTVDRWKLRKKRDEGTKHFYSSAFINDAVCPKMIQETSGRL